MRQQLQGRLVWLGRQDALVLLILFILALVPRIYNISNAPPGLNGDEIYNIIDARRIGWGHWPVFIAGNNGREALYFYFLALSLRLFGDTVFALRLPSVLFGAGSAVLAYLIGRDAFNRRIAVVAALLIAVSLWPMMPSRVGLRAISLTFFTALTVWLLNRGLKRQQSWVIVLGGLSLGLTMYTYIPSRLFPFVIVAWLFWLWRWRREQWQSHRRAIVASLLVALFVFAPYGIFIVRHPDVVNQRIYSMENALDRARAGDPGALVASVGGTLKMFSFRGDPEWRYHLAYQPVFDPLTSLLFYVGIALALRNAFGKADPPRQPAYLLLLLWLGAMIAPNAVLNENPSFLRATGAIVPTYLLAGVGFDAVYRWSRAQGAMARKLAALGLALLVLVTLVRSWTGYFRQWVNHPDVRIVYNTEQAMIGRYLEQEPPGPNTRVFVASGYVYDNTTVVSFSYFSDRYVSWFSRSDTFVWPRAGEEAWYLIPARNDVPASIMERLQEVASAQPVTFADGALAFTLYQVRPQDVAWEPTYATDLAFADGPQLAGYDIADTVYGGQEVPITLHWRIPENHAPIPNTLTYVQVHLQDASGATRARTEGLLGYPQASWQPNDRFTQHLLLAVPEGVVPGPASLVFNMRDDKGRLYPVVSGPDREIEPIFVRTRPLEDFSLAPDMTVFADTLALSAATFRPFLTPGTPLNVALDWVALRRPTEDYRVRLQLVAPGYDEPLLSETFGLWPEAYPPSQWSPLERVTTFHGLNIPLDIPAEVAPELRVELLPAAENGNDPLPRSQGTGLAGKLEPDTREHHFTPPPLANPVHVRFGDVIELLGYEVSVDDARPGGSVKLTLIWQALKTPDDNYTVFNHLLDAGGQLQGQLDSPPIGDGWLTSTWLPGEVIVEEREIPVLPNSHPGAVNLAVGLYSAESMERLPATVDGERLPSDQFILTEIEIR